MSELEEPSLAICAEELNSVVAELNSAERSSNCELELLLVDDGALEPTVPS